MNAKLIELPTEKLLEKFGIGSHVPGSGSAAALQGMLSAQLILTVINLTGAAKRGDSYQPILPFINKMSSDINERIYPRLQALFQQDSEQFDSAIQLRNARNNEKSFVRGKALDKEAQDALKSATETLVEIARLCIELGECAIYIYDNGFKSARGDSGVALHSSISAIAGCLSIISLNRLSIDDHNWINNIKSYSKEIKQEHARLSLSAKNSDLALEKEADDYQSLQNEISKLKTYKELHPNLSNNEIQAVAKKVQNILWQYRDAIWKKKKIINPIEILNPTIAFEKILKYKVIKRERLDPFKFSGEYAEIAGIIDNIHKAVGVSTVFPLHVQNFTLAHELGHVLLHKQTGLHRDRPIDGSGGIIRDTIELQADKFATFFLMPEKQIRTVFKELFFTEKLKLNDDTVFGLTGGRLDQFMVRCKSLRDFSKAIASASSFYGDPFNSIATQFNVSNGAMAIRLEELGLVEFSTFIPAATAFKN